MNKLFLITWLVGSLVLPLTAQSSLEAVLKSVESNNPRLATERQFWEAEKTRVKIGLTLPNPTVQGEYLIGSPETAGEQIDFSALQAFDLPVAYRKRRELAAAQAGLSVSKVATQRQTVLLETKLVCFHLTYLFQLNQQYDRRQQAIGWLFSPLTMGGCSIRRSGLEKSPPWNTFWKQVCTRMPAYTISDLTMSIKWP